MATIQQNGSVATKLTTKNNGGAVLRVKTSAVDVRGVAVGGTNLGFIGSRVLVTTDVAKSVNAGLIAYNTREPIALRSSSTITGIPNTALKSGADVPSQVRGIHKLESVLSRKELTAIRAGKFNFYLGKWDAGYPVVANDTGSNGTDGVLVGSDGVYKDRAATPTRTAPGNLTYKGVAKNPVTVGYKPKNG